MPKFSVIVPVYNVEKYLGQCIQSILNQTFQDYELILVNDGSTDASGHICDEYSNVHEKIKVIHKKNGGCSEARNTGLAVAKGNYIIFVDSDDYIEKYALETFNDAISNSYSPDVLITRLRQVYNDNHVQYMDADMPVRKLQLSKKDDIIDWVFNKSENTWPAVKYIIQRDFINSHKLQFAVGYYHEDIDWTSKVFSYASSFSCSDYYWYSHRMGRKGSITTDANVKRTLDIIELVNKNINSITSDRTLNIDQRNIIFKRLIRSLFVSLSNYRHYSASEKDMVLEAILNCKEILFTYADSFQHKLFLLFCRIFGFKSGLEVMSIIHRV